MKDNSVKSLTIEWLRFFCIAAVVLLHAVDIPVDGSAISYHNGPYDSVQIIFSEGLCTVAVPIFFIISGYLFFIKLEQWDKKIWLDKLKRRAKTLLLPYLLWNLIALLVSLGMLYLRARLRGGTPDIAAWYNGMGGIKAFWDTGTAGFPFNYPLWFLRELIVLVVLSPLIYIYAKKAGIVGLVLLFAAYILLFPLGRRGLFMIGLFYFTLGAYLSIRKIDFTELFKRWRIVAVCIAVPLLVTIFFSFSNNTVIWKYSYRVFTLFGAVATIGIVASLLQKGYLKVRPLLSNSAFFVYAAHGTIVLPLMQSVLGKILPGNQIGLIIKYFTAPLLTVVLLVLCYWCLNRLLPKTTAVLTGGRTN